MVDRPGAAPEFDFYLLRIFLLVYTDSKCPICMSGGEEGGRWSRTGTEVVRLFGSGKGACLTYKVNPPSPTSTLPI